MNEQEDPQIAQHHPELPSHTEKHQHSDEEQDEYTDVVTLLSWHAPGRPFQIRGKQYYLNIVTIAFFVMVVLFLFSQYMLMLVVGSLVFLSFTLAFVPPRNFHYRLSTEGVTIEDHFFLWQELYDFYFKTRYNETILHIRTKAFFPGELTLTLGEMHKEHVKAILLQYLPYREVVKPTSLEKAGSWLENTFPLDSIPLKHKAE